MTVLSPPRPGRVPVQDATGWVRPAAVLLVLGHVLLTGWRLRSTWWWQDDLVLLGRASGRPLGDLLLSDYNGHLVPGTWLVAWLVDATSGYGWGWAVGSVALLVLAVDAALLALLVRLFGYRPEVLLPLVMWVSAGSVMTPTLWWAAAMQWLPVTASLLLAWFHHVGYWRTRRTRSAAGSVLAVALGLAFFEKAALVVLVLFGFSVLYGVSGSLPQRLREAAGRVPEYWAAHLVLVVAYAVVYLPATAGASKASYAPGDLAGLVRQFVLNQVLPSLFGGPLEWFGDYSTLPASPLWFRALSWGLTAAVVVATLRLRPGAWRAWVLLLGFTSVTLALLAVTRLGFFGDVIGLDGRYGTDVVAVAVVCSALAWIPLRQAPEDGIVVIPATTAEQYDRRGRRRSRAGAAGAVAAVAVLVTGAVSAARYVDHWSPSPTRDYLETLQQEVRSHPGTVLFDQQAPARIMETSFGRDSRLSTLLRPSGLRPELRSWQTDLHVVDDTGRIRPARLVGRTAPNTTRPRCAPPGSPLQVAVGGSPLPLATWTLQFGYAANRTTRVTVALGLGSTEITLEPGLHTLFVQTDGNGDTVVLTAPPDTGLCVTNLVVGTPVVT